MHLAQLAFSDIGPFGKVEVTLDPDVNVFVGPNNTGKSALLALIGFITVYPFDFPKKFMRRETSDWVATFATARRTVEIKGRLPELAYLAQLGPKGYADWWGEYVDVLRGVGFSTYIPAIRQSTGFRSEGPSANRRRRNPRRRQTFRDLEEQLEFNEFNTIPNPPVHLLSPESPNDDRLPQKAVNETRKRDRLLTTQASHIDDEQLTQRMVDLDYFGYRSAQPAVRELFQRVADVASTITQGFPLRFNTIDEDDAGLFLSFETPDGQLPLDKLSQGTQSLVQWLSRLFIGYAQYHEYADDFFNRPGLLIVDEIDAHLHPSWQVRIIPALRAALPKLQLICSTHSPLMLSGLNAGQVHLFDRTSNGVSITQSQSDVIGWTSDEILTGLMGMSSATDQATSELITEIETLRMKSALPESEKQRLVDLERRLTRILVQPHSERLRSRVDDILHSMSRSR